MTFCPVKYSIVLLFLEHFHKRGIASSKDADRMLIELWAVVWTDWVAPDITPLLLQESILPHSPNSSNSLQDQYRLDVSAGDGTILYSPCQH